MWGPEKETDGNLLKEALDSEIKRDKPRTTIVADIVNSILSSFCMSKEEKEEYKKIKKEYGE